MYKFRINWKLIGVKERIIHIHDKVSDCLNATLVLLVQSVVFSTSHTTNFSTKHGLFIKVKFLGP